MPHHDAVRLRPLGVRHLGVRHGRVLALIAVAALAAACRQEPAGLAPRHIAVLSEDQVAAPLTLATVDDELHVLFANLDTLTLQLARLDPRRNRLTLETIDAVGIYPSDLTAFGVHAYAVHVGRQHVIYLDQHQPDALIPKWVHRDADEDGWWVTSPVFEGTPRALMPQDSGDLLLVTATPHGPAVVELSAVSGSGRHRPEGMADHPRLVWPVPCAGSASFVAPAAGASLVRHRGDGSYQPLLDGVGAHFAGCADGIPYVLWHLPSSSEVLFAPVADDGLGPTTAVTLAIGTTSLYFLPRPAGFSFVIDEFVIDDSDDEPGGRHRIALIHPADEPGQQGTYRKSVLVDPASPQGFSAAHLEELLVIVERRSGERQEATAGLQAAIFTLP